MTDQEINVTIAEACGWKKVYTGPLADGQVDDRYIYGGCYMSVKDMPNYCADLNAMHEAEKVMTDEQWLKYVRTLTDWCDTDPRPNWWRMRHAASATARQRAEAFIRTVCPEKWKE